MANMNFSLNLPSILPMSSKPRQIKSPNWEDVDQIRKSDVNLFCWEREVDLRIVNYLEQIVNSQLKPLHFATTIKSLGIDVSTARGQWDPAHDPLADAFWIDVFQLVNRFLRWSGKNFGSVHIRKIADDACRKFHVDGYSYRLFTTYLGRGTEWLPESATNRKALGKTNDLIVKDPSKVQQMRAFEVGVLRGEVPNERNGTRGIVHRSPQLIDDNENRIILRVDL
jgi:hypothetical protein